MRRVNCEWICHRRRLCHRARGGGLRGYSTAASPTSVEEVTVPCGSNGSIQLRIHGLHGSASGSPPPLIICLPRGPCPKHAASNDSGASYFARSVPCVAVEILYRIGREHRYPTPIHDVLFGYTWMLNHLVPNRSQLAPSFNDHPPARIGVFGEGIGGGLASMLALTECHSKGHGITTSAVHEPLLNWVLPEESALEKQIEDTSVSKRKKSSSNLSKPLDADMLRSLISTRSECFKGPGDWFDPFASPLLFFRSSNAPIPLTDPNAPVDEFSELSALNQQNFFKQQRILSALNSAPGLIDTPIRRIEDEDNGSVLKKSARRYPRVDSDLTLPTFRLSTGPTRFWQAQVEEFSRYLRRSMIRTDELKKRDMASAELHAEERVVHDVYAGHHDRDERLSDTAEWFRNVL